MRVVGVVQARMGSSRLPGKMLMEVAGRSLIQHVCDRLQLCRELDDFLVATSTSGSDDLLARKVDALGCHVYRGSETDVLDRVYHAGRSLDADAVVRMTGDCPLLDPAEVDRAVSTFRDGEGVDYCALGYSYPEGFGAEVIGGQALASAWTEATEASDREHVTPFIQRHDDRFTVQWLECEDDYSGYRVTVDEPSDLEVVGALIEGLSDLSTFGLRQIIDYLKQHPDIAGLNAGATRSSGWRSRPATGA